MTKRNLAYVGTVAVLSHLFAFTFVGCGGSNSPATTGTAGMTGSATGTAGTTGSGTGTAGSTGSSTGTAGTTGSGTGTAGTTGSGTGTAGTTGSGTGTAGSTGGGTFTPLCSAVPVTAAGVAPTKGGTCTASDTQVCYKTCGPASSGFKSETCTGGTYAEQSGCDFPGGNYACYKIPTALDPSCPATAPQASTACTVAMCTPCNVNGMYLDSQGSSKEGYCVCPAASASGNRNWTCASSTAWPCPAGQGC